MKVVIGCLNAKYIHMSSAPWCLSAGVRTFGPQAAECRVLESTINADLADFEEAILRENPEVLSLSCYIWNIRQTLALCRKIKERSDCRIVLGGPEVAYRGRSLLAEEPAVDYVLRGEGEFAFPPFLKMLLDESAPSAVAGLTYREGEEIFSVPEGVYTDDPPSPYDEAYFKALGGRICYIETSRGCPYRCAFCLSGRLAPYRIFSDDEAIFRDLLRLAQGGSRTIKFVDRTFNANADHANKILSFILENYGKCIPAGVCFHFEIAGDILKESTFSLLQKMPQGAVQLEIGMQSFHQPTLDAICRRTDTERLCANIRRLLSFGNIHVHIDLIAGLTGEGMAEFEKSFNTGYALGAHMLQMGFLKLLHGAPMRENPEDFPCEFLAEPPYEVRSTPWLSAEELLKLKKCESALDRLYNSGRFRFTLAYLVEELGMEPFRLFYEFGNSAEGRGEALSDYAQGVYDYFAPRCDSLRLKELLSADLLCSASASQIPKGLRITDLRHKGVASMLRAEGKKKVLIMERAGKILLVDQGAPRDLRGRYPYVFYDLEKGGL